MNSDLCILIVDDEPDLANSVRRILRLDGYQVEIATSLAELLDRDNWSDYFAILLDRRLPDGNADQILPVLNELARDTAVIMITAYADLEGALIALRHGAEDFFLKPVDPEHLRARLKRLADLRRVESELKRERAFAQIVLDTTQALILVLNGEGRVLRLNRYFESLSGYRQEELVGKSVDSILRPDPKELPGESPEQAPSLPRLHPGSLHKLRFKSGQECDVAWWTAPLKNEQGQITELICAGMNMTEYNRLQEKLIQSERLAAIGEAMAGLTHESRNALQRSQACLDLLADRLDDQPGSLELLESIQRAQDDLYRLYEEVRAYAAPIHVRPQRCDVGEILRKAWCDTAVMREGRDASLEEHTTEVDLHCEVDAFALGQVFRNILENAVQACSDPVRIEVEYAATTGTAAPSLSITIGDNGPGLPPQHVDRVFDSFFTTKTEGAGLGMAIARRILQAHDGQIIARSSRGGGAEFVTTLPRKSGESLH
ncbi:ATP-binding protein [Lignipirellula cremea]|uniref:histidine kinase n=1 Tax=Lignipirellula cremea TaxID=2528010 RepID=A0A518DLB6_9BACT|nr:ATP-binding protein [Lignipirellula cremea]QDU92627.1 Sensor histidine kinase TmoS [Lignipirellula cremea]